MPVLASPLAALPHAADFMLDVLQQSAEGNYGALAWPEINRLAARWLRPSDTDSFQTASQFGHALVLEMMEEGLLDAEVTTASDGSPMVECILHANTDGLGFGRALAA